MGLKLLFKLLAILAAFPFSSSQQAAALSPASDSCNCIFLSYCYTDGAKIPPDLKSDLANQPYRICSHRSEQQAGRAQIMAGFRRVLVSASNAVLADGSTRPALVGNGTVFAGFPSTDLKTAVETAGDLTQMQVQVNLVGTQFGVASSILCF